MGDHPGVGACTPIHTDPRLTHPVCPTPLRLCAVKRFARETGDIHALSATDLKLLALSHTLELQLHGPAGLQEHPAPVRCCAVGLLAVAVAACITARGLCLRASVGPWYPGGLRLPAH